MERKKVYINTYASLLRLSHSEKKKIAAFMLLSVSLAAGRLGAIFFFDWPNNDKVPNANRPRSDEKSELRDRGMVISCQTKRQPI